MVFPQRSRCWSFLSPNECFRKSLNEELRWNHWFFYFWKKSYKSFLSTRRESEHAVLRKQGFQKAHIKSQAGSNKNVENIQWMQKVKEIKKSNMAKNHPEHHEGVRLGSGGKPSTWIPPARPVELFIIFQWTHVFARSKNTKCARPCTKNKQLIFDMTFHGLYFSPNRCAANVKRIILVPALPCLTVFSPEFLVFAIQMICNWLAAK